MLSLAHSLTSNFHCHFTIRKYTPASVKAKISYISLLADFHICYM